MAADDESRREKATVPGFAKAAVASIPPTEPPDAPAAPPTDPLANTAPNLTDQERSLGRFEIKARLGEGGMGVVLLAVDPSLGRQVALKVLHAGATGGSSDTATAARRRLLREAQGIAQLVHENVIVVHEVGTHAGRDYVAMEYVKGRTLACWQAKRSWREIVEMYLRAGRGLAAAHAAGLVHRDFKPDNVLVGDDGRVRVTDFGLVAAVGTSESLTATTDELRDRSELGASLTATGSVMGTPRYMPPEQHRGEPVDARADQFSFCASLYEALYGRPPFAGESYAVLRACVLAGELTPPPADSEVPAAIRDAVLRGLSHDRADRFASMTELLAVLDATQATPPARPRRSRTWLALGGVGVVVAGGIAIGTQVRGGAPEPVIDPVGCRAPAIDPATAISPAELGTLTERGHRDTAGLLARDLETWRTTRGRVCDSDPATRSARLDCLDGVMTHLQVFARALVDRVASDPHAPPFDAGQFLVDPTVCSGPRLPALMRTTTPIYREAIATALRGFLIGARPGADTSVAADLVKRATNDGCASVVAHTYLLFELFEAQPPPGEVGTAAERCGDDALRVIAAAFEVSRARDDHPEARLRALEATALRLPTADSDARVADARRSLALLSRAQDEAILRSDELAAALTRRGRHRASIRETLFAIALRIERARADDVARIQSMLDQLRAVSVKELGAEDDTTDRVDDQIGTWLYARGQVEAAIRHQGELAARLKAKPTTARFLPPPPTRTVRGSVRDTAGHPVEGAHVYAALGVVETHAGVLPNPYDMFADVVTRSDGSFELPAIPDGIMIATSGDLRSRPQPVGDRDLVIEPTTELRGRVALEGIQPTTLRIKVTDTRSRLPRHLLTEPLQPDGSFVLRLPRAPLELRLEETECNSMRRCRRYARRSLIVGATPMTLDLTARSWRRPIDVVLRSTVGVRITSALVEIRPGRVASGPLSELPLLTEGLRFRAERNEAPAPAGVKPDDLGVTVPGVPDTTATACAIALPTAWENSVGARIDARDKRIWVSCQTFEPGARAVVIEAPPWPRFD